MYIQPKVKYRDSERIEITYDIIEKNGYVSNIIKKLLKIHTY